MFTIKNLFAIFLVVPDANTIAAIAAVLVSFLSVILALWALAVQRHHNRLSVRPLAFISRSDYEDRLSVKIHNNGVGPLIITSLQVSDGKAIRESVIDWVTSVSENLTWDDFTKDLKGRSLAPGDELVLLKFTGDPTDPHFREIRDKCRNVLRHLTIKLEYLDIYEQPMKPAERGLEWFGRHSSIDSTI
jgi:hypothetical protein